MFTPKDVLYLWFDAPFDESTALEHKGQLWFSVNKNFDRQLRRQLLSYTTLASEDALESWQKDAHGYLALVLLLDRVTRACYRGSDLAYSNDVKAQQLCKKAIDLGLDWQLSGIERLFLLFPLIASEKASNQILASQKVEGYLVSVGQYERVLFERFAELIARNKLLLEKFSCFPHRSKILRRGLSNEQSEFVVNNSWQAWL